MNQHDPLRGALLMNAAIVSMVAIDVFANALVDHYPVHQVMLYRGVFALVPLLLVLAVRKNFGVIRIKSVWPHVMRGVFGLTATYTFFLAIRSMTLVDATAIALSAPLFITVFSIPILGERVGRYRWCAVVIGFVGVLWMLQPTGEGWLEPVALLPLTTGVAYALLQVLTRRFASTETTEAYVFWYLLILTLGSSLACMVAPWEPVNGQHVPLMLGVGIAGFISSVFMVMAYRAAEASFIAPLDYTALVWSGLLGWLIWSEVPSSNTVVGAAVVVSAGLYIVHREIVKGREKESPRTNLG
ncbi:MAG: DMT family transporter [Pseudomonadota bacterium]